MALPKGYSKIPRYWLLPAYREQKRAYDRTRLQTPTIKKKRQEIARQEDTLMYHREYFKKTMADPIRGPVFRQKSAERSLKWKFEKRYGISIEIYNAKLAEQGGVCAICRKPETAIGSHGRIKSLSVDHVHGEKRSRGLLCNRCNLMIGYACDSVELLAAAIRYLGGEPL